MNFTWIDWTIVAGLLAFVIYASTTTRKYTKSVADFLAANRSAGRYLLGIARGEAKLGAVSLIAGFGVFYAIGFGKQYWHLMWIPVGLFIVLSGWVAYRFRATRAMTMAQFFEIRYSRNFRIFAGILSWVSGVINFGIFPSIGARFFVNFCGFPPNMIMVGPFEISLTFAAVMFVLVGLAVFFTFIGGQISIMVTDFWQGFFASLVFASIIAFLWFKFPWSQISESLVLASTPGKSLINPFDIGREENFNSTYYLIGAFFMVYQWMAWHGQQGYSCSGTTAHETKMAGIITQIRGLVLVLGMFLIPLAAITYLHHPDYADGAVQVADKLEAAYPGDEILQEQMRVPMAMTQFLPVGLMGAFAAAMLGFFISTNNTYMHSWGTILIQDVICPLRKKPFETKRHILYLRLSIIGVAVFSFFFSLFFELKEHILMFFAITGAIYLGGAGAVIIGGLYWKRGTTAAAWSTMIVGSILATTTIVVRGAWEHIPYLVETVGPKFPYNSQIVAFFCALVGISVYVGVSLLGKREVADMDRILHRGKYAIKEEEEELNAHADHRQIGRFWKMIGVNSHEFSKLDKGLFLYQVIMSFWRMGGFFVILGLVTIGFMTDTKWLFWWKLGLYITLFFGAIGSVWINIGGLLDLKKMYKRLSTLKRDEQDDGRVINEEPQRQRNSK